MNSKTLKAAKTIIEFVKDCKKNKDYPYYFDYSDMNIVINFLEFKVKEQETKNGLKGVLSK